ncbi:MAG: hypothetical protein MK194_07185 [Roseibacillus sp.]|nr:hypothetical protein [Roseibacillus sp.]
MKQGLWILSFVVLAGATLMGQDRPGPLPETVERVKAAESGAKEEKAVVPEGKVAELKEVRKSQLPDLPIWSPSDYEKVKKGEIVAGQQFFAPAPVDPEAKIEREVVELPELVEETVQPEEDETAISAEHMAQYFQEIPRDERGEPIFLSDPQELLSQQEFRDREAFLQYHSSESNIGMHVYLFDHRQELPDGTDIYTVYQELFAKHGSVALVFYYLGAPDRAQFLLSPKIRAVMSQDEQNRALKAAIQEAFEKSDAAYQLDNFLVELSIRLYWIERELKVARATREARGLESEDGSIPVGKGSEEDNFRLVSYVILVFFGLALFGLLAWGAWIWLQGRRKYLFPEAECGPLLGAPHAAGVGAVISFSNAHLPPSRQRDQMPDYLQRI